jgi:putative membrane protein
MPEKLKEFLKRWVISTVAVLVTTLILGSKRIEYGTWVDLLVATLVLGLLNSFLRPLLLLLSLPLLILTLGLFTIVINALLLLLVSALLGASHFHVHGFWNAVLAALIMSIVSLVLNSLTGSGDARVSFSRGKKEPPKKVNKDDDNGPVIDI